MLTRLRFRQDFRILVRCLSDKPEDGKANEIKAKEAPAPKKTNENATEKIQELLKRMLAEPKISEEEYAKNFTIAPDHRKNKNEKKVENIEESLTKAASDVAQAIGGDVKHTESELLSRVLGKINQTSTNLSDLLVGMKVDRKRDFEEPKARVTRGQNVKYHMDKGKGPWQQRDASGPRATGTQDTRFTQRKSTDRRRDVTKVQPAAVDIFKAQPLGIFKATEPNQGTELELWESLKERELMLATAQPPANYFEKMILWTQQGKVWKFPIDNEQGLEEEQNVHFSEHIFLDTHLEGWCPKNGPIRHFMELVCVGLSKNAFYTVQEKKDHIMWYKEYFESKQNLLSEVGAWETKTSNEAST